MYGNTMIVQPMYHTAKWYMNIREFRGNLKKHLDLADKGVHIQIHRGSRVYTLHTVQPSIPEYTGVHLAKEVFEDVVREPVYE